MKATINITIPAGRSLEGFPLDSIDVQSQFNIDTYRNEVWSSEISKWIKLHKGDTITIRIEE